MDKLIHYVNLDGRINAFYSTPTMFTQALNDANVTWTVKVCFNCSGVGSVGVRVCTGLYVLVFF